MFDKRLLSLVPGIRKYLAGTILMKWLALLANIVAFLALGIFIQQTLAQAGVAMLANEASTGVLALSANTISPLGLCGIFALAIAARMATTVWGQRLSTAGSSMAKRVIRNQVYEKVLRLGPSYAEHIGPSKVVQIGVEGVEQLEVYFGSYLPQFFYAVLAPVTLFLVLAPLSFPAALVLFICVPLIPLSIMMFQQVAKRIMKRYWGSYLDLGATFLENIEGLTTLKIYQADDARHKLMNRQAELFRRATMVVLRLQLNSITIMDILAYGGAAVGAIIVVLEFLQGHLSFAAAFAIVFLASDFFLPMRQLGSLFHTAMNGMSAADRMFDLLAIAEPPAGTVDITGTPVSVTCENVGYSYDGKRQVLENVDFSAEPGQFVAIVGESGSGKSTLAGIITGRNRAFSGDVRVCGQALADITRASLMDTITLVSFDSMLFSGTVRDNLLIARPDASDNELRRALERAQVWDFVASQGGLDLRIAEHAANLSGGQRQRIVIARALLHDTPAYVFDEAASNIDTASEEAVLRVIGSLAAQGKTVIMISHRLSSVTRADVIYVMAGGTIAQHGTHAELLAQDGPYRVMVEQQQRLERYSKSGEIPRTDGTADTTTARSDTFTETLAEADEPVTIPASPAPGIPAANRKPQRTSGLRIMARMLKLVKPLAGFMVLAVTLGVLGFIAAMLITVFGATALTQAATGTLVSFSTAAWAIALAAILRGPLHYGEQICNHFIAFRLLALIRDRVFGALRKLAPAKLESRSTGDLLSLLTSDIELLEVFYAHTISPVLIAIIMALATLIVLGIQHWLFAFVAGISYILMSIIVPVAASRMSRTMGREYRDAVGSMNATMLESLQGLRETIQFGQERQRAQAIDSQMTTLTSLNMRLSLRGAWSAAATDFLVLATDAVIALAGAALVGAGTISPLAYTIGLSVVMSGFGPFIAVSRLGATLQQTLASGARVLELLDEQPETLDIVDGTTLEGFTGAQVNDVSFAYAEDLILEHVSLDIAPGSVVQIAGKSGSGKSTLVKLLMRFWDPTSGSIAINGTDLHNVNTSSLRDTESAMSQDTYLFSASVRENIALARQSASDDDILQACRKADLAEVIANLPAGLDTPLGAQGVQLSGGERQRLGLARVFLHDAPLILLDEPTSNLDSLSEAAVLMALDEQRKDKTIVLVSHRASTAALADKVYTVDHGRLS